MLNINFWHSIGSTCNLTVMRLSETEKATGVKFHSRQFDVRRVMKEQNNIPFKDKPANLVPLGHRLGHHAAGQRRRRRT